jgi:hypothetical protein
MARRGPLVLGARPVRRVHLVRQAPQVPQARQVRKVLLVRKALPARRDRLVSGRWPGF